MPRIMRYVKGGVEIWIRTRGEHPPPHVHIEHPGQRWEIKVEFSYIENQPSTYTVHHLGGSLPSKGVINALAFEIMKSRRDCREVWWHHVADAGLKSKRVVIRHGWACPARADTVGAILVITADYDAPSERVEFNNTITGRCP